MAKVEANKVRILVETTPMKIYSPPQTVSQAPIHYTPVRNIDPTAPSNRSDIDDISLLKEEMRIALMEAVARSLRSDYRLPEKMILGRYEYDLTKALRENDKYITISAWQRPGQLRLINVKMQPSSFTMNRNEKVQAALLRIIDGCLSTAASFPSTMEIEGTTYRTNCSYAPGRAMPPKEGWLHLTVDAHFTPIASVHFLENKAPVFVS